MMNISPCMAPGGATRRLRVVPRVLLGLALVLSTAAAGASVLPGARVPDRVLANLRGGLEVANLRIDLAANLRTYIDDRLALETSARLERVADRHRWVEQRVVAHEAGPVSDQSSSAASPNPTAVTRTVSGDAVRVDVPISGADGVGSTRISHRVAPDQVFGTVANTANGRSVQQIMDVQLRVLNFRSYSEQIRNAVHARQMGKAIAR